MSEILKLTRDQLNAKTLRKHIGKAIRTKFIDTMGTTAGILEDVSGRTREYNDGRDWISYRYVDYIEIFL